MLHPVSKLASSRVVHRHAEPVALAKPQLMSIVAAVAISLTQQQAAWAGPFDDFASRIEQNMQKNDQMPSNFQDRYAKFQEDTTNLVETTKSVSTVTKAAIENGDALGVVIDPLANTARGVRGAAADGTIKASFASVGTGLNSLKEQAATKAAANIERAKAEGAKTAEIAKAAIADDAAKGKDALASVAADTGSTLLKSAAVTKDALANEKALSALASDAAEGKASFDKAVAKAQEADLTALQAQTKAALSDSIGGVAGATVDVAGKTVGGITRQLEMAKGGTADLAVKTGSALSSIKVEAPEVDLKLDEKLDKISKAGAAAAKAQQASLEDTAKFSARASKAGENLKASTAAIPDVLGDVVSVVDVDGAADALKGVTESVSTGVSSAVAAKVDEVKANTKKTDFQIRYAKFQEDTENAKTAAANAAAASKAALEATKASIDSGEAQEAAGKVAGKVGRGARAALVAPAGALEDVASTYREAVEQIFPQ